MDKNLLFSYKGKVNPIKNVCTPMIIMFVAFPMKFFKLQTLRINLVKEELLIAVNLKKKTYHLDELLNRYTYSRVLNYISYTNSKLSKIGLSINDKCTFCTVSKEDLYHLFFECSHAQIFWKKFTT